MEDTPLYSVYDYDRIEPGKEVKFEHKVSLSSTPSAESIALPLGELIARQESSMAKEKEIFQQLRGTFGAWEKQAAETQLIGAAIKYVRTLAVTHTSNQWVADDVNKSFFTRSNMVYKMTYSSYEDSKYDKKLGKSVPIAWFVSWGVYLNKPRTENYYSAITLASQDRKRYTDKAAMEKYLQGRIAEYEHLFTELSPPIPAQHTWHFCVSGHLLPGYTKQPTTEQVAADLLVYLDDEDMDILSATPESKEENPVEKSPVQKPKTPYKSQQSR